MSTALAFEPARAPIRRLEAAPALRPADRPAVASSPLPAPRVLAAATLVTGVVVVVTAQLLLSVGTAQGAYRLSELQHRSEVLAHRQQAGAEELAALAAPQHLAAQAARLGMVPDDSPAYLDARTGRAWGSRSAATGTARTPGDLTG